MFTFNGDDILVYPNIVVDGAVLVAVPGQDYALDSAPDNNWTAKAATKAAPAAPVTPPEAPVEASDATPTSTPTTN